MRKELRVYGDSFVAAEPYLDGPTDVEKFWWTRILAGKLDFDEMNCAVSGSSNASVYTRLFNDIQCNTINNETTGAIVVQLSTTGRFFNRTVLKEFPQVGSVYLTENMFTDKDEYFQENKEFIQWQLSEIDVKHEQDMMEAFVYWMQTYVAKKFPKVQIVLLFNTIFKHQDFSLVETTENFMCFDNFSLSEVNGNEIVNYKDYFDFTKVTQIDPRLNHLCTPNLFKLADIVYSTIKSTNIKEKISIKKETSVDSFEKQIIKRIESLSEWHDCIDKNLITFSANVEKRIIDSLS